MSRRYPRASLRLLPVLVLAACGNAALGRQFVVHSRVGEVSASRLDRIAAEPGQWMTSGRDAGDTYFSPLRQINQSSLGRLGFAWQYELGTSRGLEASPIVIDGVMFAVGDYGRVYALNAATGRKLWTFIPAVDMRYARYACCDVVNRGLAIWKGRVYVGALDGYLYCLDARTGRVLWRADSLIDRHKRLPYTVTGAPVIAGHVVVIGNGGADFAGVRGYVSAFDLATGRLAWRFFTVPRDPAVGPEDQPQLVRAARTWGWKSGERWQAGGGTVWDGLSYDAKAGLVIFGTGNASPYDRQAGRDGADELYACSVIAVHADTGRLAWYYQEVPGDRWDFDATQPFILTTLTVGGKPRPVAMQAAKDGFFYVFDPATGRVLSAANFTYVNWTKGLDPRTYRPIPNPAANYHATPALVWPSAAGAHSWQPMSYDPDTGLVYIPVIETPNVWVNLAPRPAEYADGWFTTQGIFPGDYDPRETSTLYGSLPALGALERRNPGPVRTRGVLMAWDPVHERRVWEAPGDSFWDGGVLSTAGGLVFQGDPRGRLNVYAAATGILLRSLQIGTAIMAAPIAYRVRGVQYIAFMAGFGGAAGFQFGPSSAPYRYGNAGRIVALRLGGGPVPRPAQRIAPPFPRPVALRAPAAEVRRGEILYAKVCSRCHVFGRGLVPDLRRIPAGIYRQFPAIVLRGLLTEQGMGNFSDELTRSDVEAIRAYITAEAWKAYRRQRASRAGGVQ